MLIAIRKLKFRKAADPDAIIGETINWAGDSVVEFCSEGFQCVI